MGTVNIDLDYVPGKQSIKDVPLAEDDVLVAKFTTGATITDGGAGGQVNVVQHNAENWNRALCISTTPGDFTQNHVTYTKPNGNQKTVTTNYQEGMTPTIFFNAAPASGFDLLPNTTYYANMKTLAASQNNASVRITLTAAK